MTKNEILKILESAKDKNGDVPMRLVRQAFEKLPIECEDAVSRKAVHNMLENIPIGLNEKWFNWLQKACLRLAELPSVTPKRKTGRWLDNYQYGYKCSECGAYLEIDCGDVEMNFCPNCGADMNGSE